MSSLALGRGTEGELNNKELTLKDIFLLHYMFFENVLTDLGKISECFTSGSNTSRKSATSNKFNPGKNSE